MLDSTRQICPYPASTSTQLPACPPARSRSIFCEPTETNRADWNRFVFRDGNRMKNRWRFDCRVSTPLPGTGDGERKHRNKEDWPPNDCGPLWASAPVIGRNGPWPESPPIPAQTPKSRPEPGGERENGGHTLTRTGGAAGWNLRFSARPIPSIVCTNSKMPDNREVFDGFTFFFMSQKQTVSATHKHATRLPTRCPFTVCSGHELCFFDDEPGFVSPCQQVKRGV
jgi:hypothetical protein